MMLCTSSMFVAAAETAEIGAVAAFDVGLWLEGVAVSRVVVMVAVEELAMSVLVVLVLAVTVELIVVACVARLMLGFGGGVVGVLFLVVELAPVVVVGVAAGTEGASPRLA